MPKLLNLITSRLPKIKRKKRVIWYKNKNLITLIVAVLFAFIISVSLFIRIQQEKQQFSYGSAPDSTIVSTSGSYAYVNETNNFRTQFKKTPFSKNSVSFTGPKGGISFYTPKKQSFGSLQDTAPQSQSNMLVYPNIFPGVNLRYTISPTRLLEEFVIQDASTAAKLTKIEQLANSYNDYHENEDGSVTFTKGKDTAFILPKPVLYELANKESKSYGIKYEISRSLLGEITISKILTEEGISWINDPARSYPIAIDLVIDNADTAANWVSNDPTNTTVSQETTIKHGGTGSVKVQTTAGTFPGTVDLFEFSSDHAARATATTSTITATGGTISYAGGYTIHTFTTSGTFTVTSGSGNVEVLVVAGGGSGGNSNTTNANGGGGGGGVIYNAAYGVTTQTYPVTVGYGGAAIGNATIGRGNNGQNSVFGTLTALGGGGGGSTAVGAGLAGGSGGGATNNYGGGAASQPGGFAYAGGATGITWTGGGGGGAGSAGVAGGNGATGGNGGTGYASSISGTTKYYAGGGGGGGNSSERAGDGFDGGGRGEGTTSYYNYNVYTNEVNSTTRGSGIPTAVANTGGGGGGGSYWASNGGWGSGSGAGASGIVIVRYPTASINTVKSEGSYALKAVAKSTTSLNKTLTRTIAAPLNLSTSESVTFDIRASRTGSNIKIGLHDSGGTTTEITPNIAVVNIWQPVLVDLTGVSAGNKDAIDQIIITVTNADADNTFYLDNMKNVIPSSYQDTVSITKSAIDLSNTAMLNFWVRSSVAGSFGQFQFGESNSNEQTFNFTVDAPNTWEQKTWDISAIPAASKNAVTELAFQFISDTSGATFYFDDLTVSPPNTPSLNLPINTAINQSLFTALKTTGVDDGGHYLRYKIELCTDVGMTAGCQTFDQTTDQTGWSGQDTQTSTAYSSGVQATYTIQTTLLANDTYYWRSYAIDPGATNTWSATQAVPYSFTTSANPNQPTNPYAEGVPNPRSILDLTPEFSAIHNDTNGDSAIDYQIQVNTAADFTGTVMWDSGEQSISPLANGARSTDVSYAGTALTLNGQTYYWRIRFWDSFNLISPWSDIQNFSMNKIPDLPTLDFPSNGATDQYLNTLLRTTSIDVDGDYLRYKIDLCTNLAMNFECQTFDQTLSQVGWISKNSQTNTAYTSGRQAIYTVQTFLQPDTTYYWRSYAIDPAGKNVWSSTQTTPNSFTTMATPLPASSCYIKESISNTQLSVMWTDNASNEDFYEIQRKVDGGAWMVWHTAIPANTISYVDNTILNGHTYQYRIAPYFVGGFYASWCEASTLTIGTGLFNLEGIRAEGLRFD